MQEVIRNEFNEKPFTIGFSRQGCMDDPIQYEIVYSDSTDNAMWKWIKANPRDFFRSKSVNKSTQEDIEKYGKIKTEVISMKPEQLRKGNLLINQHDGSLIVVTAYDIYCLEEGMDSMIMQPIPISEEWLLKLGAKKMPRGLVWISLSNLKSELHFESFIKKRGEGFDVVSSIVNVQGELILDPIKYVHQLQNLYYALTGEEITIKK